MIKRSATEFTETCKEQNVPLCKSQTRWVLKTWIKRSSIEFPILHLDLESLLIQSVLNSCCLRQWPSLFPAIGAQATFFLNVGSAWAERPPPPTPRASVSGAVGVRLPGLVQRSWMGGEEGGPGSCQTDDVVPALFPDNYQIMAFRRTAGP